MTHLQGVILEAQGVRGADRSLTGAVHIPCEAETRREVQPLRGKHGVLTADRKFKVAMIEHAGGRILEYAAFLAFHEPVVVENHDARNRLAHVLHWENRLPAYSVVRCKARRDFPGVLHICRKLSVAC